MRNTLKYAKEEIAKHPKLVTPSNIEAMGTSVSKSFSIPGSPRAAMYGTGSITKAASMITTRRTVMRERRLICNHLSTAIAVSVGTSVKMHVPLRLVSHYRLSCNLLDVVKDILPCPVSAHWGPFLESPENVLGPKSHF